MSTDTEQKLTAAIHDHLVSEGVIHEGEFVGDWIMNVYLPTIERREESGYAMVMTGGSLPDHVAVGLLTNALDRVRGIGVYEDDDES